MQMQVLVRGLPAAAASDSSSDMRTKVSGSVLPSNPSCCSSWRCSARASVLREENRREWAVACVGLTIEATAGGAAAGMAGGGRENLEHLCKGLL